MSEAKVIAEGRIVDIDLDSMTAQDRMALVNAVISRMTVDEISALISLASQSRQARVEDRREQLLEKWRNEAAEIGLTLDALLKPERKSRRETVGTGPSKFRGPKGESWSGRGRPPNWLSELEATGSNRDQFRVSGDDA
jgi:DNA-binding protein H-NS